MSTQYKWVPAEPTPQMEQAATAYWDARKFKALSDSPRTWSGVYSAMLDAAPPVEAQAQLSDDEILSWASEEQFFLFCDEDELLQIARAVLDRFGGQIARRGTSQATTDVLPERRGLTEALNDAATALETVSRGAGQDAYGLRTMIEVRGYATSGARIAREALAAYRKQPAGKPFKSDIAETEKERRLERDISSITEKIMALNTQNRAMAEALKIAGHVLHELDDNHAALVDIDNAIAAYREEGYI